MIRKARKNEAACLEALVRETIEAVYPKYYPQGAVYFFLQHHSIEHIAEDVLLDRIYVLEVDGRILGTVTIKDNEITRLFVKVSEQRKGYGTQLIRFAQQTIFEAYDCIQIDASFPAKALYRKLGYRETLYHQIETENGDYLCYDQMVKLKS